MVVVNVTQSLTSVRLVPFVMSSQCTGDFDPNINFTRFSSIDRAQMHGKIT